MDGYIGAVVTRQNRIMLYLTIDNVLALWILGEDSEPSITGKIQNLHLLCKILFNNNALQSAWQYNFVEYPLSNLENAKFNVHYSHCMVVLQEYAITGHDFMSSLCWMEHCEIRNNSCSRVVSKIKFI